jgi:hypothetical protein
MLTYESLTERQLVPEEARSGSTFEARAPECTRGQSQTDKQIGTATYVATFGIARPTRLQSACRRTQSSNRAENNSRDRETPYPCRKTISVTFNLPRADGHPDTDFARPARNRISNEPV